jgi:hypothetical protein
MLSDFVCCERSDPQRAWVPYAHGRQFLGDLGPKHTHVGESTAVGEIGGVMLLLTPPERLWCLSDHIKKAVILSLCDL